MSEKEFDTVGFIIDFEGGEASDVEIIEGFQHLINTGMAWTLQGFYGRTAKSLIEQGFCKDANEWTRREAKEQFEQYCRDNELN